MGFVGGVLAEWVLNRYFPGGRDIPMGGLDREPQGGVGKLERMFGAGIFEQLRGKTVIDFGCGGGENSLELARRGCERVIGLEIQDEYIEKATKAAAKAGLSECCVFARQWDEPVDVVVTTDAFEHFEDPGMILGLMRKLLKPGGYVLAEFGPTWYHPYGGHLFSVFPWAHLVFTEASLIRWRSGFKTDGARRFGEVAGGLNQMTIRRWEKLVEEAGFEFKSYELVPIRPARRLHNGWTREFLTAVVKAELKSP